MFFILAVEELPAFRTARPAGLAFLYARSLFGVKQQGSIAG
jgi:hypothetical protein